MEHEQLKQSLPQDHRMECALLGAIIVGHKNAGELLDVAFTSDFFDDRNRRILKHLQLLHAAGIRPELLSLHDALKLADEEEAAGGIAYVASLVDGVAKVGDVLYILRGLRRMATHREVIRLTENVQQLAFEQAGSAEELLDGAIEKFSGLARDLQEIDEEESSYRDSSVAALMQAREDVRLKIYTGVESVDQLTGGFREQELVLVTAETGTGKSLFAAQIRAKACHDGLHSLFCTGEMTAEHLASRELATVSGVEPIKMRRHDLLTKEDFAALVDAAAHQCPVCRILDGELDLVRIRRAARRMKARSGLDLVILDYDELIEAPGKTEFDQQRVIARAAKSLAIELGCVVILISQLRKVLTGEDARRPTLQRLYGSGAKQKFASYILLADRPYVRELTGDEKEATLWLLKSRDGRVGRVPATFNVRSLRFEQAEETPADRIWDAKERASGGDR